MPLSETASRVVDIHAHLVPIGLIEATKKAGLPNVRVIDHGPGRFSFSIGSNQTRVLRDDLVDTAERLNWMDRSGIDVQVVGTWADIFGYSLTGDEAIAWARLSNQTLAEAVDGNERLEALATLPMQEPDAATEMVSEIAAQGFVGVTFAARIGETELDATRYEPVWAALSEHQMVVFIHPGYSADDQRTGDYGMVNAVGRPVDTTIAAARLLGAGIPSRHEGARIILAHGGGAIAFILGRLRRNHEINPKVADPSEGLSRLFFDTVMFDPDALCYLIAKTSAGSVLLGSDYPFPIGDPSPTEIVTSAQCLDPEQRMSVLGDTATRLMRREREG